MASTGFRSLYRASLSATRSLARNSKISGARSPPIARAPMSAVSSSPARRLPSPFPRSPVELGCCSGLLLPLHTAVAAARLTSCLSLAPRTCRTLSQDGSDGT